MTLVYDFEILPNLMTVTFIDVHTDKKYVFEVSERKNEIKELIDFINKEHHWLVGYNSYNFDSSILAYIVEDIAITMLTHKEITRQLYDLAVTLISDRGNKIYSNKFTDIDLMKVGGLFKSLKLVGVSLKWPKLQDMPINPHTNVKTEQIDEVLQYNLNDVLITKKLYEELLPEIKMRYDISREFNVNGYSESRSGLANRLLEKFYHETTGIPIREFKKLRTERSYVPYKSIILDNVVFKTPKLRQLLREMKDIIYYKGQPFFSKKVEYDGNVYKLGIGGLHTEDEPGKFIATDDMDVIDADVASYYPSLIIEYNILPQHLDKSFIRKYRELKEIRVKAKHEGRMVISDALKIVLNSSFGKMLNENHWLYDPAAGLKITINGQLFLLMLVERLTLAGFKVISANTDGIITLVPKARRELYDSICEIWQQDTGMELEYAEYSKYIRKDVNNYIAIKKNGKIKTKGIFSNDISLSKGYDKPIISTALYEYFVNGKDPYKLIDEDNDLLNFCAAYKIDDKFVNIHQYVRDGKVIEEELQKSVRYYVSYTTDTLFKRDKVNNKDIRYESEYSVYIVNDLAEEDRYNTKNVNRGYYKNQVRKIIEEIENPQLKLWP